MDHGQLIEFAVRDGKVEELVKAYLCLAVSLSPQVEEKTEPDGLMNVEN